MSDRAYLTRTKFEGHDGTSWGWRIGDDYFRSYTGAFEEHEVPVGPLELLAKAARKATGEEHNFFENILYAERGLLIDGSWHEFQEIASALRKAFGQEE